MATRSAIGGDAVYYFINLRSLAIDRNLDFKNEYIYLYNKISPFTGNHKVASIPEKNPITNKLPNKYPLGTAVFLIPFFLLGHFVTILLNVYGLPVNVDGYGYAYQFFSAFGSFVYAFLGLLIIYSLGKKIFDHKISLIATMAILFATPLLYHVTMEPLGSHPISMFSVTLFMFYWYVTREKRQLYQWVILGLIGGLMSLVRYQDGFFLLVPIIDSFISRFRPCFLPRIIPLLVSLTIFLLTASIIISIQIEANYVLYGSLFSTGYTGEGFIYLKSPKLLYSLLSPQRGLLFWSPILIFAFVGLYWFIKKYRAVGFVLLFSFLVQWYLVSSWSDPSQGDSFGNRILQNSTFVFALGLMQFLKNAQKSSKYNHILWLFVFLALLNGVLAVLFCLRVIGQPY